MSTNTIVDVLLKMADDEDNDCDREQRQVLKAAATMLNMSAYKIMHESYRAGFCDAIQRGTKGTNIHITAKANANAYALDMLKGSRKIE